MLVGLGVDIAELDRIQAAFTRFGERFLTRAYTPYEVERMPKNAVAYLASRFAAKEAAAKALGTGFRQGVSLRTIEVYNLPSGKPELRLYGPAADHMRALGAGRVHVSLTDGRDAAVAVVILES